MGRAKALTNIKPSDNSINYLSLINRGVEKGVFI